MRIYHRHRVYGLEHLRAALRSPRPVILVGNHCMDIVDPLMLQAAFVREIGRAVSAIGHQMIFFGLPGVRWVTSAAGVVPSRNARLAEKVLRREGALMLYPGAGQEAALRSYRQEPYRLKWYDRSGFVELALRTEAIVLFVAGVGIDEMYFQTDIPIPPILFRLVRGSYLEAYRGARIQLGAAGVHVLPGVFPFPVRVTHVISAPLSLDAAIDPGDRDRVDAAQVRLWADCQALLDRAVEERDRESDWLDRGLRAGMASLQRIGL